jgi:hypothetical protein
MIRWKIKTRGAPYTTISPAFAILQDLNAAATQSYGVLVSTSHVRFDYYVRLWLLYQLRQSKCNPLILGQIM